MSAENTKNTEVSQEENVERTELDEALELASQEVVEAQHPDGKEMVEWVFTNDKTNPHIRQLFHLFMNSAFVNKVGLMHAKVKDENEIHTIIVGVEQTPDGLATWPIAKVLTEEEQARYQAPDGEGNFIVG